jgi:hypothetical protein
LSDDIRYDIREYLGHPNNPAGTFRRRIRKTPSDVVSGNKSPAHRVTTDIRIFASQLKNDIMVRSYCLAKRCMYLRRKTLFFPLYKIEYWCSKMNCELSKVLVCPLEKK